MNTPDTNPQEAAAQDTPTPAPPESPAFPASSTTPAAAPVPTAPLFQSRLGFPGKIFTCIATLGPLGMRMPAPGTWGSGAGWLFYFVFFACYNKLETWATYLGISVALILIAILVCHIAEKHVGMKDPGQIIFDEFAAMPLVFIATDYFIRPSVHYGWAWFFGGFVLFRFFDVLKPFGIKKLQKLPGGIGIVVDDIAAALAACVSLHLIHLLVVLFS